MKLTRWIPGLVLAGWLATAFYMIATDEQGVLCRFGRVVDDRVPPGIHVKLPWPCDAVTRLKARETKRLGLGVALAGQVTGWTPSPAEVELLSGDKNIVNVELVVQYNIAEPGDYLFGSVAPEDLLKAAAKNALLEVVGRMPVEEVLYEKRVEIQQRVQERLAALAGDFRAGVSINSVNIQRVYPPPEVAAAFNDVVSAKADRFRLSEEAHGYANDLIPKAQGEAYRVERLAEAYRQEKIEVASGAAQRVREVFAKYQTAPEDTRNRLYLETLEQCLARARKVIVDTRGGQAPAGVSLIGPQ
ncbi:MAG: FtsH protease activity modulator HflK [Verrucomicrobia bacterium]|nr:FtsH protease activity modulator HflK [Verrucomicrobiota bacterium]